MEMAATCQSGINQVTSIERVFSALIYTCKLTGGYPFKHRDARLMIAYRIAMVLLHRFLRFSYFTPLIRFQETLAQESSRVNVGIFFMLYVISDIALSVGCIFTGALYHRTTSLVLRKKLDSNYLRPISSWGLATKSRNSEAPDNSQHADKCNARDFTETIWSKANRRVKTTRLTIERGSEQRLIRLNEVTLARYMIIFAIVLTAAVTFTREEYGNHLVAKSHSDKLAQTASVAPVDRNVTLSHATRRHLSYLQLSQEASLFDLCLQIVFDLPLVWLAHLLLAILEFFQNYGQVSLGFMSTACMTEILKRIGEQEGARVARERSLSTSPKIGQNRRAACAKTTPSQVRSKSVSESQDCPLFQTTELLVHIRDVLVALRSTLTLDYLFASIFDVCRLITIFGSILVLLNTQRHGWALVTAFEFLRINIITIFGRLGYHRLHTEASRIKGLIYERLVHSFMESGGSVRSFEADSRIETITNYRLAKEIEELWPTDWSVPDIKSCLSRNLLVITFVATLQQLVDMRSQLK